MMITEDRIDVTVLEPRMKHATIFNRFDELAADDSFVIVNDHDPKPLFYQLSAERGDVFTWDYLEAGPQIWQVRIARVKLPESESSIGELVAADFRTAEVFSKYKIDFCCGGKKKLSVACREKQIDLRAVEKDLKELTFRGDSAGTNYNNWDPVFLIDYIINVHHKYVAEAIPVLLEYTHKVSKVHGKEHTEVITIAELFKEAAEELLSHMRKEETILFPYIKQIANRTTDLSAGMQCSFGRIQNPIRMMEQEHELVGNIFKTIRELSDDYTPPAEACTTYKVSYLKLMEFEKDLHQHIHLENNILFPKSMALELQ